MRLIDAYALLKDLQKAKALSTRGPEYNRGLIEAQRIVINAPTLDDNRPEVAYLCKYHRPEKECKHTTRIEDAINFEKVDDGKYIEKERHGEWIWKKDEDSLRTYDLLCSECGCKIFTCENYDNVEQAKKVVDDLIREGKTLYPFCPNCGSRNIPEEVDE